MQHERSNHCLIIFPASELPEISIIWARLRNIASILLILVMFFNWFGYRVVSDYLEQRADIVLEEQIDNSEYDEASLFEIKVPINLPYQTNWKEFERFDGEIEVNGIHYKYVKRKVYNDSLVLLCVPHEAKMKLQTARDEFFKLVYDLQHPSQNKKSDNNSTHSVKNPVTDYFRVDNNWTLPELAASLHNNFYSYSPTFLQGYSFAPDQPPRV